MNSASFPSPSADLSASIRAMRGEVGDWGARRYLTWAVASLLHALLGRIVTRMEGLVARFLAGRVLRRVARVGVPVAAAMDAAADAAADEAAGETGGGAGRAPRLPGGFLWLVKLAGYHAMAYQHQLRHVLAQPKMVALLTACPQAARVLRPLCRALGVETSLLHPGVPVVARDPRPTRVRVRKPRLPIDWGRIPLPRGVLSAARRAGFKPVR